MGALVARAKLWRFIRRYWFELAQDIIVFLNLIQAILELLKTLGIS
jgi:hypothetical protein